MRFLLICLESTIAHRYHRSSLFVLSGSWVNRLTVEEQRAMMEVEKQTAEYRIMKSAAHIS
jgi:hypothetical protein